MNRTRLLERLLEGAVNNVAFSDLVHLAEGFGSRLARVNGSHHVFAHPDILEVINLQDRRGKAKPYQVRQLLQLVEQYNLELESDR